MITSLHHSSFTVSNVEKSIAFYRDVLGMEVVWDSSQVGRVFKGPHTDAITECPSSEQRIVFMALGDCFLELVQFTPTGKPLVGNKAGDTGSGHACFLTDNMEELKQKLLAYGARLHCEPQRMANGGWILYFRDPDGIILEAIEGKPPVDSR